MLKKQYVKSRQLYKVTFELATGELPEALEVESVNLVGDFNQWDVAADPMTYSKKARAYRATIELEPGREYQFRYVINGEHWCNDWAADSYLDNGLGADNCVVSTTGDKAAPSA
jgi:1,4-alpha-glucan branching enzyme